MRELQIAQIPFPQNGRSAACEARCGQRRQGPAMVAPAHQQIGIGEQPLRRVGVIEMSERYFLRPRLGASIPCTNC